MAIWTDGIRKVSIDTERTALDFIDSVEASEPLFDFASYASDLVSLPELATYHCEPSEPSAARERFLTRGQELMNSSPMQGLKVITILCCNEQCASYPKSLGDQFFQLMVRQLESPGLQRREALEWGLHCWQSARWPKQNFSRGFNVFIPPLLRLLIAEAETAPQYVLDVLHRLEPRRSNFGYVFSQISEDAWDTVRLGRVLYRLEPRILRDSLERFLRHGRQGFGGYRPGEEKLRTAANELHGLLKEKLKTSESDCESLLNSLILYAFADEPWYFELHELLWSIELQKTQWTEGSLNSPENSLNNLALIAINCGSNEWLRALAEDAFQVWGNDFTGIDRDPRHSVIKAEKTQPGIAFWLEPEPMEKHAKVLIDTVSAALHGEYPRTRNRSFGVPDQCGFVDHAIAAYWKMVDWLQEVDSRLYFQVLLVGIANDTFATRQTDEIGRIATQRLIDGFEQFARTNLAECSELVALMISRSGYSEIGPIISSVLDEIFPMLQAIDEGAAITALEIGLQFQSHHMYLWKPRLN